MKHTKRDSAESVNAGGKILIFAPSDADSDYLAVQRELAELGDDLERAHVEPLRVFEGTEVPTDRSVLPPERSQSLRSRYDVPRGRVTVLALSPAEQQPVSRIVGDVSRLALREAIASISAPRL